MSVQTLQRGSSETVLKLFNGHTQSRTVDSMTYGFMSILPTSLMKTVKSTTTTTWLLRVQCLKSRSCSILRTNNFNTHLCWIYCRNASTTRLKKSGVRHLIMRQGLPRIPKDRIAVLIGSKGATQVTRETQGHLNSILTPNLVTLKLSGENLDPMIQSRR